MNCALSILIPTFNDQCVTLVDKLRQQAEKAGIDYEILVGDDGSTDDTVVSANRDIEQWTYCRYLRQPTNSGRAAIRNFLASKARYEHLLFIDSDMTIVRPDFIYKYVSENDAEVIDGGVVICGDATKLNDNLRYRYEKASEDKHTTVKRRENPYHDFHTANFLIRRDIMLEHPFDSRFRRYGYEDVLFGKQLQQDGITITHIDNPMSFEIFEDNTSFVSKTEEGLQTLHRFQSELQGFSHMLNAIDRLRPFGLLPVIRLWHRLFGSIERQMLVNHRAPLWLFSLYRLGYFLNIK